MDESRDGIVLLIGSGQQVYREYLMKGASRRRSLWLIDENEPTWQRPYISGSSSVKMSGRIRLVPDQKELLDAALNVTRNHRVSGIFTYDEMLVMGTAEIADRLGLPSLTTAGAEGCRNKHKTRLALTEAGLPQPRFALAMTAAEAAQAAADIGYPIVLKPRGMGASIGVVKVGGPEELAAAFDATDRATQSGPATYEGGVLVEEMVDGAEISVDGAVVAGDYTPFCIAHKELGAPPYFEEVGHLVDGRDPLLADADLRDLLARAHRALGVRYGITHTEVRFSARGPVVIEVNARLGGDLIPYLGKLATGVDPGEVAVDVAAGVHPDLEPSRGRCAGIRFIYPPDDCRVMEISVPEAGAVPGLVAAHSMAEPGTVLRLPPRGHLGRYAYVVCTADNRAACAALLAESADLVHLKYEALNESQFAGRPW